MNAVFLSGFLTGTLPGFPWSILLGSCQISASSSSQRNNTIVWDLQ
jgi:hypothetical protein